jgi:Tfp pilus assembly PilM family ATPase
MSPIAIDFGVASLKVLQVADGENPSVVASAVLDTPAELLAKDAERLQYQFAQLPKLLKGKGFKGKRAVFSVPAAQTLVHHFMIPSSPGVSRSDQLAQQLVTIAQRDPSSMILREFDTGEIMRGGQKYESVLCIAMPREVVMQHMEALRSCKLETVGVHSEHLAMLRVFDPITRRASDRNLYSLYIDLGYGSTKVVIAKGRDPVAARTIPIGGRDLDLVSAKATRCSIAQARERRCRRMDGYDAVNRVYWPAAAKSVRSAAPSLQPVSPDTPTDPAGTGTSERREGATPSGHVEIAANPGPEAPAACSAMQILLEEIAISTGYLESLHPDRPLSRIVFVGGEARMADACELISSMLEIPAQIASPTATLDPKGACEETDFTIPQPGWSVAVGLCVSPTDL